MVWTKFLITVAKILVLFKPLPMRTSPFLFEFHGVYPEIWTKQRCAIRLGLKLLIEVKTLSQNVRSWSWLFTRVYHLKYQANVGLCAGCLFYSAQKSNFTGYTTQRFLKFCNTTSRIYWTWCTQNRHLKVFNRGAWHSKNWQKLHLFILFHVSIWGAWSFAWGDKLRKSPPVVTRQDVRHWFPTCITSRRTNPMDKIKRCIALKVFTDSY